MPPIVPRRIFVSFDKASQITKDVCRRLLKFETEEIPLEKAAGRIIAEDLHAKLDIPPFDNSSMDGFAVRSSDIRDGSVRLKIVETIPAGSFPSVKIKKGEAARIMTGSPIPAGADAVVMKEFTKVDERVSEVLISAGKKIQHGENVRYKGEDIKKGRLLIKKGAVLSPYSLGLVASQGLGKIRVLKPLSVGFITTGNEVVMPSQSVEGRFSAPHKGRIYNINRYTMEAMLVDTGCKPIYLGHSDDNENSVTRLITTDFRRIDVLITIGGVSMGEYDVVKDALRSTGAKFYFEKIWMKPGRPTGFAVLKGKPVFTLPGNVVSSLVAFDVIVRPAIFSALSEGRGNPSSVFVVDNVVADFSFSKDDERRHILRVKIDKDKKGSFCARLAGEQGSGILSTLAAANGYVFLPEGKQSIRAGDKLKVIIPHPFLNFSLGESNPVLIKSAER